MKAKELYRTGNIVFWLEVKKEEKRLAVRDAGRLWGIVYDEHTTMYTLLNDFIGMAKENEAVAAALDATFHMLYMLSNSGLHSASITNDLVEVYEKMQRLIQEAIDARSDKEQERKEGEDWLKRDQTMEEMAEAAAEEEKENGDVDGNGNGDDNSGGE